MNTNPNAKTIVCYGDSNTWGDTIGGKKRYPANVRWIGVLQDILGREYEVINEGLCGRTFVAEIPEKRHRTGITHLQSILNTNNPIDIVIIMLGTNDTKDIFGLTAEDIADHLGQTTKFIQNSKKGPSKIIPPEIIIICPSPVFNLDGWGFGEISKDAPATSLLLAPLYEKVAQELGCRYLDAGDFINLENTDGYHFAEEHHKILGEKVAEMIK
jgi:lysophospholipase L1-like esterase